MAYQEHHQASLNLTKTSLVFSQVRCHNIHESYVSKDIKTKQNLWHLLTAAIPSRALHVSVLDREKTTSPFLPPSQPAGVLKLIWLTAQSGSILICLYRPAVRIPNPRMIAPRHWLTAGLVYGDLHVRACEKVLNARKPRLSHAQHTRFGFREKYAAVQSLRPLNSGWPVGCAHWALHSFQAKTPSSLCGFVKGRMRRLLDSSWIKFGPAGRDDWVSGSPTPPTVEKHLQVSDGETRYEDLDLG